MQIGVTFPQNEIGADPIAILDYVQAAEELGYSYLVAYDHIVGAGDTHPKEWGYSRQLFHEPFVLFGYIAALTRLELVTAVIILPQRQTALLAKQAAEIDILTHGKFRMGVGVGWNPLEYEAQGADFHTRGRAIEEQVEILRQFWTQDFVTYKGRFHTINDAGLNPPPVQRPIPIWMGGSSDSLLRRVARIGDGWFPQGPPDAAMHATLERLRGYTQEAGRDPGAVGIDARLNANEGDLDDLVRRTEEWSKLGATHISLNTMRAGYRSPGEHIEAIRRYMEAVKPDTL